MGLARAGDAFTSPQALAPCRVSTTCRGHIVAPLASKAPARTAWKRCFSRRHYIGWLTALVTHSVPFFICAPPSCSSTEHVSLLGESAIPEANCRVIKGSSSVWHMFQCLHCDLAVEGAGQPEHIGLSAKCFQLHRAASSAQSPIISHEPPLPSSLSSQARLLCH